MGKFNKLFRQTMGRIPFTSDYYSELMGANLGIKDEYGNEITFYRRDYYTFKKGIIALEKIPKEEAKLFDLEEYMKNKNYNLEQIIDLVKQINSLGISEHGVQLIKYFSNQSLKALELDAPVSNFKPQGDGPIVQAGTPLLKNGKQNCVVMHTNSEGSFIYMHPKIRPNIDKGLIGVNHISLATQQKEVKKEVKEVKEATTNQAKKQTHRILAFAGSFSHSETEGWVLDNTTGHYASSPIQVKNFLVELKKKGMDLSDLTVKIYTAKVPNPTKDSDYDIHVEKANDLLTRTETSLQNLEETANKRSAMRSK